MPGVRMTVLLRDIIKVERKKRSISTISLSTLIGKGKAYISQIESGKISGIDLNIIYDIFKGLIDMPSAARNEYIINNILDKATNKLSKDDLRREEWLNILDMNLRLFYINDILREIIIQKRTSANLTPEEFVLHIKRNTDHLNTDGSNQLSAKATNDIAIIGASIRFEFPDDFIERIENGSVKTISYIDMQCILENLLRLEGINPFDSTEEAKIILKNNGFSTLFERGTVVNNDFNQNISHDNDLTYYDLYPTKLRKEHADTVGEIIEGFEFIRDKDIAFANKRITQLLKSMQSDISFVYAIFGLPFDKLETLDFETKNKLLLEMKKLLKSYIPDSAIMSEDYKDED